MIIYFYIHTILSVLKITDILYYIKFNYYIPSHLKLSEIEPLYIEGFAQDS